MTQLLQAPPIRSSLPGNPAPQAMEKLDAVLDDAGAAPSAAGAPARIAALAAQHRDNIHLTTFDPA